MQPGFTPPIEMLDILPTDVSVSILSSWIDIKDVVALDSAICNQYLRPLFTEVMALPSCNVQLDDAVETETMCNFYKWVAKRDYHMQFLKIFCTNEWLKDNFDVTVQLIEKQRNVMTLFGMPMKQYAAVSKMTSRANLAGKILNKIKESKNFRIVCFSSQDGNLDMDSVNRLIDYFLECKAMEMGIEVKEGEETVFYLETSKSQRGVIIQAQHSEADLIAIGDKLIAKDVVETFDIEERFDETLVRFLFPVAKWSQFKKCHAWLQTENESEIVEENENLFEKIARRLRHVREVAVGVQVVGGGVEIPDVKVDLKEQVLAVKLHVEGAWDERPQDFKCLVDLFEPGTLRCAFFHGLLVTREFLDYLLQRHSTSLIDLLVELPQSLTVDMSFAVKLPNLTRMCLMNAVFDPVVFASLPWNPNFIKLTLPNTVLSKELAVAFLSCPKLKELTVQCMLDVEASRYLLPLLEKFDFFQSATFLFTRKEKRSGDLHVKLFPPNYDRTPGNLLPYILYTCSNALPLLTINLDIFDLPLELPPSFQQERKILQSLSTIRKVEFRECNPLLSNEILKHIPNYRQVMIDGVIRLDLDDKAIYFLSPGALYLDFYHKHVNVVEGLCVVDIAEVEAPKPKKTKNPNKRSSSGRGKKKGRGSGAGEASEAGEGALVVVAAGGANAAEEEADSAEGRLPVFPNVYKIILDGDNDAEHAVMPLIHPQNITEMGIVNNNHIPQILVDHCHNVHNIAITQVAIPPPNLDEGAFMGAFIDWVDYTTRVQCTKNTAKTLFQSVTSFPKLRTLSVNQTRVDVSSGVEKLKFSDFEARLEKKY